MSGIIPLYDQAKAEVERLRGELKAALNENVALHAIAEKQRTEVERLKAAISDYLSISWDLIAARRRLRAALTGGKE